MTALVNVGLIRSDYPLPSVVGASVKLHRAGSEWKGCCPFHADRTPSFTIFDDDARFHCFGCGAGGDVLDFVGRLHGVDLREAAAMLTGSRLPVVAVRPLPPRLQRDTVREAREIWRAAAGISGTAAEGYLRSRGIHCRLPESLRFARLRYQGKGELLPCLIALVAGPDNKVAGIQRTYVSEDGGGKAKVPTPKLSLGQIAGGAIRLAPAAGDLIVTGGLEDGLTLQQETGRAVWAVTGEGNMASLVLPVGVKRVTIGADLDPSGERHAQKAAETHSLEGRSVRIIRPNAPHKDFNAELMEAGI